MGNDIPARYSHLTDEEAGWLEEVRAPEPAPQRCCARCRRGTVPGQFPCGRAMDCPCHSKGT